MPSQGDQDSNADDRKSHGQTGSYPTHLGAPFGNSATSLTERPVALRPCLAADLPFRGSLEVYLKDWDRAILVHDKSTVRTVG
jgi:hypothetical protein